ncbi:hypothetical protein LWI29_012744 [Acer saccharum]|uniref:MO25-like protein At5g47540 n=1 Tax=Acer saccharum TaxID=4024 RepID=A0AA39T1V0_ACESA|nr:hypothetical protein LWI29_012744 [Acer saccharum]
MKGLFVKSKPKTPPEVVCKTRTLLVSLLNNAPEFRGNKREEKMAELNKLIRELKTILYGSSESEPVPEACKQLTSEFFKGDTLRLLIGCLPKLNLEARKDSTQVVANLQRQPVEAKLVAAIYLEENLDLLDTLRSGYEDTTMALHYGGMLRECIRHQSMAKYVLESEHLRKFFDYMQLPSFEIAADAMATFKELMTRHKSTVAAFLSKNCDWLLADILLDRSNAAVMVNYVSSKENLKILMNLLRLFAANQDKPPDIVNILIANRAKLLRYFADFKTEKEDEQFEEDKAAVVKAIVQLELIVN